MIGWVFRFGHINLAVFFHLTQPVLLQMQSTDARSRPSENVASMIARREGAFSLSMKARRSHGWPRRTQFQLGKRLRDRRELFLERQPVSGADMRFAGRVENDEKRGTESVLQRLSHSDLLGGSKWLNLSRKGIRRERKKRSQAESMIRLCTSPSDRLARLRTILLLLALST